MCCDRLRDFLRGQYGIEASDGGTQVLWRQVGIAHCHRQGAVAEEVFQLGQGRAPDEQPGPEASPPADSYVHAPTRLYLDNYPTPSGHSSLSPL